MSFYGLILIFSNPLQKKETIFDFTLLLILILLDMDGVFYHETYDPLVYFIFFLLVKNKFYSSFTKKFTNKKFVLVNLFCIGFYALSILKAIYSPPVGLPPYKISETNLFNKAYIEQSTNQLF